MPLLSGSLDAATGRPIVMVCLSPAASLEPEYGTNPVEAAATIDTGASRSVICDWVYQTLRLDPVGNQKTEFHSATTDGTPLLVDAYLVDMSLSGEPRGLIGQDIEVVGSTTLAALNIDMLIGRDILARCHLAFDGPGRRFHLSFNEAARATAAS